MIKTELFNAQSEPAFVLEQSKRLISLAGSQKQWDQLWELRFKHAL
jgi:hypothetical protein